MGSPGVDESATGQSRSLFSSSQPPSPWPWPLPSQMTPRHPALTPMLPLTPGMATTAMVDTEGTMVATTDLTDTATTARDLLMRLPPAESGPNPDADADAWYGYYGHGYGGYRGYYGGYYRPYAYGYYGKRSADEAAPAESGPNAEANADPWYS